MYLEHRSPLPVAQQPFLQWEVLGPNVHHPVVVVTSLVEINDRIQYVWAQLGLWASSDFTGLGSSWPQGAGSMRSVSAPPNFIEFHLKLVLRSCTTVENLEREEQI